MSKKKSRDPVVDTMIARIDALEGDKKKITPRKGWSEHTKPREPKKPAEPLKEFTYYENIHVKTLEKDSYVALADLDLPEGFSLSDLMVSIEDVTTDCYGGTEIEGSIIAKKVITEPNSRYEEEMKKYEKALDEWKAKKAAHSREVKEWRAWVKQLEDERLEKNLAQAEELLKAHGRLDMSHAIFSHDDEYSGCIEVSVPDDGHESMWIEVIDCDRKETITIRLPADVVGSLANVLSDWFDVASRRK